MFSIQSTLQYIGVTFACASFCLSSHSLSAETAVDSTIKPKSSTGKLSILKEVSKETAQIAKSVLPGVVSVRTEYSVKAQGPGRVENGREQLDPFQEDFWERFFGFPMPEQKGPRRGQGSGFVISADGYILTNNHVVRDADQIIIGFTDGRDFPAKVIGQDPNTDIALLKIDAKDLPFLTLGDSDEIEIGEWVMAVGSPLRLQGSVTTGVISAKGRSDLDITLVEQFIQTDAAINLGNSGGCLVDADGLVIGMNTAIATSGGGSMGIGFAIPSNILKHVSAQLRTSGHVIRGYLGVALQKIDAKLAQAFSLEKNEGALVSEVVKDSPADKGGLKSGDVILKINGKLVENVGSLRTSIALMQPNEKVNLTIIRNKEPMELSVMIGTHPENEVAANDMQNKLGMLLQDLTPDVAQQLGYETDRGVLIKYVDPNSPAQDAGLRRGQLILSVNQKPVTSAEEFYRVVKESHNQKHLLLQIKAGQVVRYVTLEIQ